MTRYIGNQPDVAGAFYCSNCGKEQRAAEYCRYCHSRTNAALRYNTRSKVGRDGRRAGDFYRGPAEKAKEIQQDGEVPEKDPA